MLNTMKSVLILLNEVFIYFVIYVCMYIIAQSTDVLYTREKLKYLGLHRRWY